MDFLVTAQPWGCDRPVPGNVPGRMREMLGPVSTRALQVTPSIAQSRYSPAVWSKQPTRGDVEGNESTGGDSSPVMPPWSSLNAAVVLGFLVLGLGSSVRRGPAPHTDNIVQTNAALLVWRPAEVPL